VGVEGLVPFEHEVDGTAELVGEDAQGLSFPVFALEAVVEPLALGEMTDHGDGRLTEGPLEVDAADLVAGGPEALSGGGFLAFDEAGIGGEALDGLEATDVVDLIEKGEGEDLSDAGDGVQTKERLRIVDPGLPDDGLFEVTDEFIVGVAEGEIGLDALLEHGVLEGVWNGLPLVLVNEASRGARQIVLVPPVSG